ncbi:MAG TPA: hypothetical protein VL752_00420, partial [Acidisoma sp.]|nr:hypothetical protein [Acidisoma sp.]
TAKTSRWAIRGGEPGPFAACIAGLDLALWDLTARRAGERLMVDANQEWDLAEARRAVPH